MGKLKSLTLLLFLALSSSIPLNAATATLFVGQTYQTEIDATGYHYLSIESVSSTNPSVTVAKMGLVVKATINAYFGGEATITARLRYQLYAGQSYQYRNKEFTISCNDTHVNVSPASVTINVGESCQLSYGFSRNTFISPSLQWSSSDNSIATVSSTGIVTAQNEGNATIYLRSNLGSNTSECRVIVSDQSGIDQGGEDSSIADKEWYNENESEFEISSLSQMLGFRNLVNEGHSFKDKTVKLSNDIDLSSYNWTTPIGIYPNVFKGTFDGNGHSLKVYIENTVRNSQDEYCFGFFGNVWGLIRNLTLRGSIKVDIANMITYTYVGTLCGYSSKLESCINEASLTFIRLYIKSAGNSDRIGGIVGNPGSSIINCINRGDVLVKTKYSSANTNNYYIGGISGYGASTITGCVNYGTIRNETSGVADYAMLRENIGGITGWCVTNEINRCSNFGNIIGNSEYSNVGGIFGGSGGGVICASTYVGKCEVVNNYGGSTVRVNGICGQSKTSDTYSHNYTSNDIIFRNLNHGKIGNTMYSSSQMKTIKFAEILGSDYWIGADGLYPVVKGSLDEYKYYISTPSNITCYTATVSTNIGDVLGNSVKNWGILMTKDDGKETYIAGSSSDYNIELTELVPDRSYQIRWFAQNNDGKEFYGIYTSFTTKSINPTTGEATELGVSSVVLKGKSYLGSNIKYGFFIQKDDNTDIGKYYWNASLNDDSEFSLQINNLEGNSKYKYASVIEYEDILYAGELKTFETMSLITLLPTNFSDSFAQLNGEIAYGLSDVYFELRASELPSVVDSDIIKASLNNSRAYAQSPTLTIDKSYKYRLVAHNETETLYGDWIEFLFNGESAVVKEIRNYYEEVSIFSINGTLIFKGKFDDFEPYSGLYIVKCKNKAFKIRY